MTLPTFLGIGVPRAGTTWLHAMLDTHPQVYVPRRRKEIHYFDMYYERGVDWYRDFFPSGAQVNAYKAIGEITPHYFYCSLCPQRIAEMSSITKLILILRNPVDRAFSYYVHKRRGENIQITFQEFLKTFPEDVIEQGFYSKYLSEYLRYFSKEQILILIQEQAVKNLERTKSQIAEFLDIQPELFPPNAGVEKVNQSRDVKHKKAFAFAASVVEKLQGTPFDRLVDHSVNFAKKTGMLKFFGTSNDVPVLDIQIRHELSNKFLHEIVELEAMIGIDLSIWRTKNA